MSEKCTVVAVFDDYRAVRGPTWSGTSARIIREAIEVVAGTRPVTTGGVRVQKHVDKRIRKVDVPVLHEEVDVKRVPVNRVVDEMPSPHRKGDVLIIPVVEEELVITKRLLVKEEIHITKKRFKDRMVKEVELERERAEVQRLDEHGRVVARRSEAGAAKAPRRRGLLD